MWRLLLVVLYLASSFGISEAQQATSIRFSAEVNGRPFACGESYAGIGSTKSTIKPKDFRLYISHVRLVDTEGQEFSLLMDTGSIWQADDTALLDFENASGLCINGNEETNDSVRGTVPSGHTWRAIRFTLGVPFSVNHLELTSLPPPLNLTALSWVWNAGHKFARIEFATTGQPRGWFFHLGSTGCMPNATITAIPTICSDPNRPEVGISDFDPERDVVVADLGSLLADSNVDIHAAKPSRDLNIPRPPSGCMSFPDDPDCIGIFSHLGLPFGTHKATKQDFFRKGTPAHAIEKASTK